MTDVHAPAHNHPRTTPGRVPVAHPTRYTVCLLPETADDYNLYAITVEYRGRGKWAVLNRSRYLDADGTWSYGFSWSGAPREPVTDAELDSFTTEEDDWKTAHRFDHGTALTLAARHARTLTYRGRTVADALTDINPTNRTEQPADNAMPPTLAALRDLILADPSGMTAADAEASARTVLAAHAHELAGLVHNEVFADRDHNPGGGDHNHNHIRRGGMLTAVHRLHQHADQLDAQATGGES